MSTMTSSASCFYRIRDSSILQLIQVTPSSHVHIWEDNTRTKSIPPSLHRANVAVTAIDLEGPILVLGYQNGLIERVHLGTRVRVFLGVLHKSAITAIHLAKDSKMYVSDAHGVVSEFGHNEEVGVCLKLTDLEGGVISALRVYNNVIYAAQKGSTVKAYDKKTGVLLKCWPTVPEPPIHQIIKPSLLNCMVLAYGSHVIVHTPDSKEILLTHGSEPLLVDINDWRSSVSTSNVLHILTLNVLGRISLFEVNIVLSDSVQKANVRSMAEIVVPGHNILYAEFSTSKVITFIYEVDEIPRIETVEYVSGPGEMKKGSITVQPKESGKKRRSFSGPEDMELSFGERLRTHPTIPTETTSEVELTLNHALQSNDPELFKKVFSMEVDDVEMVKCIKTLSPQHVLLFLNRCAEHFRNQPSNRTAALFMKSLLTTHMDMLRNEPSLKETMQKLSSFIEKPLGGYSDFLKLKGRMFLVMSQIEAKKNRQRNINPDDESIQSQNLMNEADSEEDVEETLQKIKMFHKMEKIRNNEQDEESEDEEEEEQQEGEVVGEVEGDGEDEEGDGEDEEEGGEEEGGEDMEEDAEEE